MKMRGVLLCVLAVIMLSVQSARADQARDWPLNSSPPGTFAHIDYLGAGGQLSIEHRQPFYGGANVLTLNGSTLVGQYFGQVQASAALRVLILEVVGSVGYRTLWRNLAFQAGENGAYCKDCDRPARREADPIFDPTSGHAKYPYAEAGVGLFLPLNNNMVFGSQFLAHYEDSPDRSYDQLFAYIHDGGLLWISETTMFFKHKDWGAIGPYLQIISMPRAGRYETEVAAGFNALTRVGLITRNDVLVASLLVRPGDGVYGQHWYYWPARLILDYRITFEL
jgi:hypothetical protein